jgi:autotransporter family porin
MQIFDGFRASAAKMSPACRVSVSAAVALLLVAFAVASVGRGSAANATTATANGWTTSGAVNATAVARGSTAIVTVTVRSSTSRSALIDVEISDSNSKVHQRVWDSESFYAGQTKTYKTLWTVPANAALVKHNVRVGVFETGWRSLQHWNNDAASFTVTEGSPTTTTASATSTSSTQQPTTTRQPTTTPTTSIAATSTTQATTTTTQPPTSSRFSTLPVGATLPGDAECAARVRKSPEIRSYNATFNQTKGAAPHPVNPRVTGNFTGSTDEILQWVACKWGVDEDIVRAQIAKESWWKHATGGDLTTDQSRCHPELRTTNGSPCPESYGLGQVRYAYHTQAMTDSIHSSAYNVDYTYAVWRSCFEGRETWLNQFERGRNYAAGDVWGCVGLWFSGRWYTQPANDYIAAVQSYLNQRIWTTQPFVTFAG